MRLKNTLKLSLGTLLALPLSLLVGNDIVACGGGGGGTSPAAKAAKKAKQAKAKLSFKKRQLSKMAAAGESTTKLEAEIAELEALLSK